MKKLLATFMVISTMTFIACSDSNDEGGKFVETTYIVKGKAEKGPLVRGSKLDMRTLNSDMTATGQSYTTTIESDNGDFNFGAQKFNTPYAKLTASGYFFNEVKGSLSDGAIDLNAIVDLSDAQTINVNILTQLKSGRITHLVVNEKKSFKEANSQAQKELLTAFGLQNYATKDASQFSITSGDDAAGVLIAVSSYVQGNRGEAQIVEFISKLTNEFTGNGKFSDATVNQLRATLGYLNDKLTNISDNIKRRYKELGYDVNVKDLAYYFDWDGDGIAGNEIDEGITDYVDKTAISVPKEGGDFTVNILCKSQLSLEFPFTEINGGGLDTEPGSAIVPDVFYSGLYDGSWKPEEMSYTNSIEGKVLKIHVDKTKSYQPLNSVITLFDARGKTVASISITQDGDTSLKPTTPPMLGQEGKSAVAGAFKYLRDGCSYVYDAAQNLGTNIIYANDQNVRSAWANLYSSVNLLLNIKYVDKQQYDCYSPFLDSYLALNFLYLTSYWGDVPYFRESLTGGYEPSDLTRKSVKEIYNSLEGDLKAALPFLEDKRNAFVKDDLNIQFFVAKDVARMLLAQIYVAQKNYADAIPYIENIMSSNHYALVNGEDTNGKECILGVEQGQTRSVTIYRTPNYLLSYPEALLTLAECYYETGSRSKASNLLKEFCQAKGVTEAVTLNSDAVLSDIAKIRKLYLYPFSMSFVRRHDLGISDWGMKANNLHNLLFPIPSSEIGLNPYLTQNPGY